MNFVIDSTGDVGNLKFLHVYWLHVRLIYP